MRVCVIYGGTSTEKEVSIKTAKQIIENLDKNKYEVLELKLEKNEDIFKIKDMKVDFAYIALHGKFGEDGYVQAILETLNIAYSGSNTLTSAVCMDKDMAKRVVSSYGITTAKWWTIRKGEQIFYPDTKEKLIVKPNSGGSSIGVRFVNNIKELEQALNEIFSIDTEAIIEEVIEGVEISVPVILEKVYPAVRIEALKSNFFDYASKYDKDGAKEYVYEFDKQIADKIKDYSEKIYRAVKCNSYLRVDYIIKGSELYMIEINTLPGMTASSLLPKSLNYVGIEYKDILDLLIEASMKGKR